MTKNTVKTGLSNLSIVTVLALGGFASGCADDGGAADSADSSMDSETDGGTDEGTDEESTESGTSESDTDSSTSESGDGDGDTTETTGDGDSGDGDSTETTGDGDSGDGDGDGDSTETTGDGDSGDGDGDGDGDSTETTGDGDSGDGDGDGDTGMADTCGDGVVDEGEVCDDGNDVDIDGCTSECEITPDVVAYWQFNEEDESNGIPDLTGNFDLDYVAGDTPGLSGGMAPSQGRDGAWYTYPGSTRHGEVEGKPLDSFSGTIAGWVKPPSAGNDQFILIYWQGEAGGNGWGGENETHLGVRDDNRFTLRRHNCQVDSSVYSFTGDGWYHVVGSWEQVGQPPNAEIVCRLHVSNGSLVTDAQTNQVAAPQTSPVEDTMSYFGRSGSDASPRYFRGYVDELMVFDRALSTVEMGSLRFGQNGTGYFYQ